MHYFQDSNPQASTADFQAWSFFKVKTGSYLGNNEAAHLLGVHDWPELGLHPSLQHPKYWLTPWRCCGSGTVAPVPASGHRGSGREAGWRTHAPLHCSAMHQHDSKPDLWPNVGLKATPDLASKHGPATDLLSRVAQGRGGWAEGQEPTAGAAVRWFGAVWRTSMSQSITFVACKGNTEDLQDALQKAQVSPGEAWAKGCVWTHAMWAEKRDQTLSHRS